MFRKQNTYSTYKPPFQETDEKIKDLEKQSERLWNIQDNLSDYSTKKKVRELTNKVGDELLYEQLKKKNIQNAQYIQPRQTSKGKPLGRKCYRDDGYFYYSNYPNLLYKNHEPSEINRKGDISAAVDHFFHENRTNPDCQNYGMADETKMILLILCLGWIFPVGIIYGFVNIELSLLGMFFGIVAMAFISPIVSPILLLIVYPILIHKGNKHKTPREKAQARSTDSQFMTAGLISYFLGKK